MSSVWSPVQEEAYGFSQRVNEIPDSQQVSVLCKLLVLAWRQQVRVVYTQPLCSYMVQHGIKCPVATEAVPGTQNPHSATDKPS